MSSSGQLDQCQREWNTLLSWIEKKGMDVSENSLPVEASAKSGAGRGLFVKNEIEPGRHICNIPSTALINSFTLAPLYSYLPIEGLPAPSSPSSPKLKQHLNATQIISLHLALYRPRGNSGSSDVSFGPYIDTLPQEFQGHPLTWLHRQEHGTATELERSLLKLLPPSVKTELREVLERLETDWEVLQACLGDYGTVLFHGLSIDRLDVEDFLWAWLNVNTRCIYLRLFSNSSNPSNLTLCPIVDFANHSTSSAIPMLLPAQSNSNEWHDDTETLRVGQDFAFVAAGDRHIQAGEELHLRYGGHSNRTLFTEYGFVDRLSDPMHGEVEVSNLVKSRFESKHDVGAWMQDVLEIEGYTRAWSLHMFPPPAHPSWTLVVALRLLNLDFETANVSRPADLTPLLKPWRDSVLGLASTISEANETRVRKELADICHSILARSGTNVKAVKGHESAGEHASQILDHLRLLWAEESNVAAAVLESLDNGLVL